MKNPAGIVVIEVLELTASYGEDIVLRDISFCVREGEIFVILGESGSGKSTLMKYMIGLLSPKSGRVLVDGEDLTGESEEVSERVRRKIGILFQSAALIGSMTVGENVALPLAAYAGLPRNVVTNLVNWKLGLVGLAGYADHLPSEISGGMKKRAGLARALALNPRILFLDEPSAGLDPVTGAEIDELILQINRSLGTTMVIVTHELESIYRVADRVIMLDKETKSIIAEGDPLELRKESRPGTVRRFFNREPRPEGLALNLADISSGM